MGEEEKVPINIVVIGGNIDSSKVATTGQLINKFAGIDKPVIERWFKREYNSAAETNNSWMLDKLMAEFDHDITFDIALGMFETETTRYYCTAIDAPGDSDFLNNIISATSPADCAVLIINSNTCGFQAPQQHALLSFTQMICCCNKMDDATSPKLSKDRYDEIVKEVSSYLNKMGCNPGKALFFPISGIEGDHNMSMGLTFLRRQELYKINWGINEICFVKPGTEVGSSSLNTQVKSIEMHHLNDVDDMEAKFRDFGLKHNLSPTWEKYFRKLYRVNVEFHPDNRYVPSPREWKEWNRINAKNAPVIPPHIDETMVNYISELTQINVGLKRGYIVIVPEHENEDEDDDGSISGSANKEVDNYHRELFNKLRQPLIDYSYC
ncbi:hypothetical protein CCACVL1_04115 [Corchorus capsularis]|uniref:Tr-type G domain-containing protein n=1 Tax=Corchorus capsularis TaxID=210143 RepID=A0A1R3JVI6_COCAP|nr:hypothetical protein CCACVL1_04115 [Corchorus capsularis]